MLCHWVPVKNSPAGQSLQQWFSDTYSSVAQLGGSWLGLKLESDIAITCSRKRTRGSLCLSVTAEDGLMMVEKEAPRWGPPCREHSRDYLMLCCGTLEPALVSRRLHNTSLQSLVALS